MAEETATFALKIDAEAEPAAEAAASLEKFRAAIEASQASITSYRKSMSLLRGSSDEVADAKAKLKAAIAAEQAAITRNNLGILKLGGSYQKLSVAHRKATASSDAMKKSVAAIGGPVKDVAEKLEGLKGLLAGATTGAGALAVGAVALVAVFALLAAGAVSLVARLTEFTLTSADALRNARLMREAVSGNVENATAWGHVIDWVSLRLATSKDHLNDLVVELDRATRGTRVSGGAMVDIFNSVATASEAMGSESGKALEEILTRGKMTGRFWLGFKAPGISELQGTGISYQAVAEQLGKNLGIGTEAAKRAMFRGAVSLDAGAKAVREVVDKRFATINEKKLLSIDSLWTKFKDNVRDFASDAAKEGGALEPILKGLKSVVDMFGLQTESGQRTKAAVTAYATAFAAALQRNLPLLKAIVAGGLEVVGFLIHATAAVLRFSQSGTGIFLIKTTLEGVAVVLGVIAAGFVLVGAAVGAVVAGVILAAKPFYDLFKIVASIDWGGLGRSIVDGIKAGLRAAWDGLKNAVVTLAQGVKSTFANLLGIHSPSVVFQAYGRQTSQGYAQGVEEGAPQAERATSGLGEGSAAAARPGASSAGGGGGIGQLVVNFQIHGGTDPQGTVAAIKASSLLEDLEHTLHAVLRGAGVPVGAPALSGGST